MKRTLIGTGLVILIMSSSFHFSIVYLNYMRSIGIGFTSGVSLLKPDKYNIHSKEILRALRSE